MISKKNNNNKIMFDNLHTNIIVAYARIQGEHEYWCIGICAGILVFTKKKIIIKARMQIGH